MDHSKTKTPPIPTKQTPIIFADSALMVICKPADKEVLELRSLGEPAHRLDKDTSGVLILARNQSVKQKLQDQFKRRAVIKKYLALVVGKTPPQAEISGYLARDPKRRRPFIFSLLASGKERGRWRWSKTSYQTLKHLVFQKQVLSFLEVNLLTGRTHQIRIHLHQAGFPILGDKIYTTKQARALSKKLKAKRQFLHAFSIQFHHPETKRRLSFSCQLAADLKFILNQLNEV